MQNQPIRRTSANRRQHPRRSTCLDACVEFGDVTLPCVVVDVSAGGAQLLVCFPEKVEIGYANLVIETYGSFSCRVAWHSDTRAGLAFLHDAEESERRLRNVLGLG